MTATHIEDEIVYLPEAALRIGRHPTSARTDARNTGCLIDRTDSELPERVPVSGGGVGVPYALRRDALRSFNRLLWLDKEAPASDDAASQRTVGLAIYLDGDRWTGIGDTSVLRELAAERPDLLEVTVVAANRVEVTPLHEGLQVAVELAWRP